MTYFEIDLLRNKKKSTKQFLKGIAFIIISIIWISLKETGYGKMTSFDWLLFGIFILAGIFQITENYGFTISPILGKAFIKLSDDNISYKKDIFSNECVIFWNNIKSIQYHGNNLIIHLLSSKNESVICSLKDISNEKQQKLKKLLTQISKNKNINKDIED